MNVLITFKPNKRNDNFEGSRLRKTIKGALEMVDVSYSTTPVDEFDVAHLLSVEEENILDLALEENKPIIISALYSESDPIASFIDFKSKDGVITNELSSKTLKFLNKADLVLVPFDSCVDFLRKQGVTTKIKTLLSGLNLARFDFSREDEKEIFYRYFREDKKKKLVIANGDYDSKEGIGTFIRTAQSCPDAIFYYFGQARDSIRRKISIYTLNKKSPSNCHFLPVLTDDIYRSALLNADVFMVTTYKYAGAISIMEAMAAKCQLIVRKQAMLEGQVIDQKTGYVAEFSETLSSLTKDYINGKLKSTILDAYDFVKEYTLKDFGTKLKEIYENEIKLKEEKSND